MLEHGLPGGAVIDRFPQAAGGRAHVHGGWPALHDGDGGDAAAHIGGAERPRGQSVHELGVSDLGGGGACDAKEQCTGQSGTPKQRGHQGGLAESDGGVARRASFPSF